MLAVTTTGQILGFFGPAGSEAEDVQFEHLVEKLGLAHWLSPGDVILRDRGFSRSIPARDFNLINLIEVVEPALKGHTSFTTQQVYENRSIASARCVVEQVNARFKTFRILQNLSLKEVPMWEHYITIAAGLSNQCFDPFYPSDQKLQTLPISAIPIRLEYPSSLPTGGRGGDEKLFDARQVDRFDHPDAMPTAASDTNSEELEEHSDDREAPGNSSTTAPASAHTENLGNLDMI